MNKIYNERLKVDHLNVSYGETQVLWDVGFTCNEGEIVAIVGSNGAGKTTIVNTIAGLIKPKSGNVIFEGGDVTNLNCRTHIQHGIVLVPEGRQLFSDMTIVENLEMGACTEEARREKSKTIEKVFKWFPKLYERRDQKAGTMSGGEQQMVAFARGMMGLPKLLIMDEPSLGLAPNIVDDILEIVKRISKEDGLSVILVEQDVKKSLKTAERGYVLENGRISLFGKSELLLNNPDVKKAYLGF